MNATITRDSHNNFYGFAKISQDLIFDAKAHMSSSMIHLFMLISHFSSVVRKDGSPWNVTYAHIQRLYMQEGHNSKRSFRTAMEQLKKRGYIWQFRVPIGSDNNGVNNCWRYVYICNDKPDTTFTGCVSCNKNGLILINGKPINANNCSDKVKQVQEHLKQFAQVNCVKPRKKIVTENGYSIDVTTGEVIGSDFNTKADKKIQSIQADDMLEKMILSRIDWAVIADKYGIGMSDMYRNILAQMLSKDSIKCKNAIIKQADIRDMLLSELNQDSLCYIIDTIIDKTNKSAVVSAPEYLYSCIYNNLQQFQFLNRDVNNNLSDIDNYDLRYFDGRNPHKNR